MDRSKILGLVDQIYQARVSGDSDAIADVWDDDATYRMMGDAELLDERLVSPNNARQIVSELTGNFTFHSAERVDAIVEGNRVAVTLRVMVSAGGGKPYETHMLSIWEFNDSGKALSLVEFVDTALVRMMISGS